MIYTRDENIAEKANLTYIEKFIPESDDFFSMYLHFKPREKSGKKQERNAKGNLRLVYVSICVNGESGGSAGRMFVS